MTPQKVARNVFRPTGFRAYACGPKAIWFRRRVAQAMLVIVRVHRSSVIGFWANRIMGSIRPIGIKRYAEAQDLIAAPF